MRIINIFGIKISLDIKKNTKSDLERYSPVSTTREKILYLILVMSVVVLSSKVLLIYNNKGYKIGQFAEGDIYAQKMIVFRDDEAKEKIIEDMIRESGKEYVYSSEAKGVFLAYFNEFFNELLNVKAKILPGFQSKEFEKKIGKRIPDDIVNSLLDLSNEALAKLRKSSEDFLTKAYDEGIYLDTNEARLSKDCRAELNSFTVLQRRLVDLFIVPNYKYDAEKTKQKIYDKVSQIKDQYVEIKAGTLLVKTGEMLTEKKLKILESADIYSLQKSLFLFAGNVIYLIMVSCVFYIVLFTSWRNEILEKGKYRSIFLILLVFFLLVRIFGDRFLFGLPLDTALFLLVLIAKEKFSGVMFSFMLLFMLPLVNFNLLYPLLYAISFPLSCHLLRNVTTRANIISTGVKSAMFRVALFFLLTFFLDIDSSNLILFGAELLIGGLVSGTLTVALLPYFERTFNILTVFKLLELGDLSHPLLKKLSVEAPGTFNHSMMVATLAENAAQALGLNYIFARVACYYHDIGKTRRPKFFTENREGEPNPHDDISPFMSKLIIANHTKDGVEMGREEGVPLEIRNIMLEHHGTTLIAYFYNKAKMLDPNVSEEDFRYPGPKPRSKESGIIMLADAIEAAVRSLDEKSAKTMETTIRAIVKTKIEENQLIDTYLTFKDIEVIIKSFIKSLIGIHHERVKYPGQAQLPLKA
ncbi:MAG: HDIG domain-containing protein [Fusobacteriaceae bacterium]|jgi:putative nucleotidyltransferase with HDIG domain|nr:HDIG domain-containing protein [Fusobacteriaceae bacterium]